MGGSGAARADDDAAGRATDCSSLSAACASAALGRALGSVAMHARHRSATPCGQSSGTLRAKVGTAAEVQRHRCRRSALRATSSFLHAKGFRLLSRTPAADHGLPGEITFAYYYNFGVWAARQITCPCS